VPAGSRSSWARPPASARSTRCCSRSRQAERGRRHRHRRRRDTWTQGDEGAPRGIRGSSSQADRLRQPHLERIRYRRRTQAPIEPHSRRRAGPHEYPREQPPETLHSPPLSCTEQSPGSKQNKAAALQWTPWEARAHCSLSPACIPLCKALTGWVLQRKQRRPSRQFTLASSTNTGTRRLSHEDGKAGHGLQHPWR